MWDWRWLRCIYVRSSLKRWSYINSTHSTPILHNFAFFSVDTWLDFIWHLLLHKIKTCIMRASTARSRENESQSILHPVSSILQNSNAQSMLWPGSRFDGKFSVDQFFVIAAQISVFFVWNQNKIYTRSKEGNKWTKLCNCSVFLRVISSKLQCISKSVIASKLHLSLFSTLKFGLKSAVKINF